MDVTNSDSMDFVQFFPSLVEQEAICLAAGTGGKRIQQRGRLRVAGGDHFAYGFRQDCVRGYRGVCAGKPGIPHGKG